MRDKSFSSAVVDPYGPTLTLSLVLDALDGFDVVHMPRKASRRISWCQAFFADRARYGKLGVSDENVLYFTEPTDGLLALGRHAHSLVAIVAAGRAEADDFLASLDDEQAGRALVLLQPDEPLSLACVISLVQLRVQRVQSWGLALRAAARQENAIQQLLNLGEDMFGNFMNVSDGSYALLGYTTGIAPVGPLNTALVRRGYHDADAIGKARKEGVFGQWRKQRGVQVFEATEDIPCRFMTYVMKRQGQYCGHVVMVCNNVDVSELQVSLFELFALACNDAVNRELSSASIVRPDYYGFLARLMSDARCSQDFINSQSVATGIPIQGVFRLALIDAHGGEFEGQVPFLASALVGAFTQAYVFQYEDALLALFHEPSFTAEGARHTREKLAHFCAGRDCLVYLSDDFARVRDIRLAYQQVKGIERHRRHVDIWRLPDDDIAARRVFTFDDAFSFVCFESAADDELRDYSVNHSALERLAIAQTKNDASDLRFLHCYLFNERRTAPTAKQLGLHRNSIIYRAASLRERYDIDLDQPSVRERLATCIKMKIAVDPSFAAALATC